MTTSRPDYVPYNEQIISADEAKKLEEFNRVLRETNPNLVAIDAKSVMKERDWTGFYSPTEYYCLQLNNPTDSTAEVLGIIRKDLEHDRILDAVENLLGSRLV